jgi:hypothetical protein
LISPLPRRLFKKEAPSLSGALYRSSAIGHPRPAFPGDDFGQTAAVTSALASATAPLDVPTIAAAFKQGHRIAPEVASALAAPARTGLVTTPLAGFHAPSGDAV